MKIGFIGLGNMGMPMALNLHKSKKIDLLGYDVSAKSLKKFKSKKEAISREYYIKKNRVLRNRLKNENFNTSTI